MLLINKNISLILPKLDKILLQKLTSIQQKLYTLSEMLVSFFLNPSYCFNGLWLRLPDADAPDARIPESELPRCMQQGCNGLLRPHVVWFGESLDPQVLAKTDYELENCDLCLVVSLQEHCTLAMSIWFQSQQRE